MAQLLDEIQWGEPILPPVADPAWEAEIKRRGGKVGEVDRRVAPNAWLREACLEVATYRPSEVPQRLFNIGPWSLRRRIPAGTAMAPTGRT
jgi:hypothetical protein